MNELFMLFLSTISIVDECSQMNENSNIFTVDDEFASVWKSSIISFVDDEFANE